MKIGKLAEAANVSASRIRFYEKHGLIPQPNRQDNGYRDYPEATVSRLRTITMSKSLGFSLSEIKRFLPQDPSDEITRADVMANLETKMRDVDQKILDLKEIRRNLAAMMEYMSDPEKRC